MNKKVRNKIFLAAIIVGVALVIYAFANAPSSVDERTRASNSQEESGEVVEQNTNQEQNTWSYEDYNYQFAEGSVLGTLDSLIGQNGRVAFYLPPTEYVEVDSGSSYGVAFALNNPEPIPEEENYFEYSFVPDQSTLESCDVSMGEASSWIAMGHKSFGKIPKGWVDKMTVYFQFPENQDSCTAKYNFEVTRDGQPYGSEQLEFRIQ